MKTTLILILLIALFAVADAQQKKFKQKHGELKGLQKTFEALDGRLVKHIKDARKAIEDARKRRNRHHAARRRAHSRLRSKTHKRLKAEAAYNAARKSEERAERKFKVAHKTYIQSKKNYRRTFRRETKNIKDWDHERYVIERIRRLLGVNHSKTWKAYKKQKRIDYQKKKHRRRKFIGTRFHQGRKRFTSAYKSGYVRGTADDRLRVYVNGHSLGKRRGQNNWTKVDTWKVRVKKGDVLQFVATNNGVYHAGRNPGGLRLKIRIGNKYYYTGRSSRFRCRRYSSRFKRWSARTIRRYVKRPRLQTFNWARYHKVAMSSRSRWVWTRNYKTKKIVCFFLV